MRKIIGITIFFFLVIVVYLVVNNDLFRDSKDAINESKNQIRDIYSTIKNFINENKKEQGRITIENIDTTTKLPIKNTVYTIINSKSADIVDIVLTDETGRVTSKLLDYGTSYKIRQTRIMNPYELDKKEYNVEISDENNELITENHMFVFVTELYIPVGTIKQGPELPNGCEITSLTSVLNYFGYEVSKTEMSDVYLQKQPFKWRNNKLYGADPYQAYAGDPRLEPGGFFTFAPPIVKAANQYIAEVGGTGKAFDISGSTREEIVEQLDNGFPVVIWITIDLQKPSVNHSWYIHDTEEYFSAIGNSHTVVLNGYDENNVHVMDPLKGQVTYNANTFFDSYHARGSHAMIVINN
jgi:uncharacterized protein YvpB